MESFIRYPVMKFMPCHGLSALMARRLWTLIHINTFLKGRSIFLQQEEWSAFRDRFCSIQGNDSEFYFTHQDVTLHLMYISKPCRGFFKMFLYIVIYD